MNSKTKKGQVTIFIILGLLIISAVIIVIYVNMNAKKAVLESDYSNEINQRPHFTKQVTDSYESCLRQLAKKAFILIGERGGYIYSPIDTPTKGDFVNSEGITYLGNVLPYWQYVPTKTGEVSGLSLNSMRTAYMPALCKAGRNCITVSPAGAEEKSIEGQVELYIEENIISCVDNFSLEKEQGYIIEYTEQPIVYVSIRNKSIGRKSGDVLIQSLFPVTISKDGSVSTVEKYQKILYFDFSKIYKRMYEFMLKERQEGFIEQQLLFSMDSLAFTNVIPAYKQYSFFTEKKTWDIQQEIVPVIKNLIETYVPLQKIKYTRNWDFTTVSPSVEYQNPAGAHFRNMVFDIYNDSSLIKTSIDFEYISEEFDSAVWMADNKYTSGGKVKQKGMLGNVFEGIPLVEDALGALPIWEIQARYFASYPVLITFTESNALDNEDYSFSFSVESNIADNVPVPYFIPYVSQLNPFDSVYCDDRLKKVPVNVTVKDMLFDTFVPNAEVSVTCADRTCEIGETDGFGQLNAMFPECGGTPYITVEHKDYMLKRQEVKMKEGINPQPIIQLHPKVAHNYTVMKLKVADINWWQTQQTTDMRQLFRRAVPLTENDTVAIQLVRNLTSFSEKAYTTSISVEKGKYTGEPVKLIKGDYRIMATLISHQGFYIPIHFGRAGNESVPKRCATVGKMSELVHMDTQNHILGGSHLSFGTNNHYICKDEPGYDFQTVGFGWYMLMGVPVKDVTTTQNEDCNNFVNNYFTKKLPIFSQVWDDTINKTVAIQYGELDSEKQINETITNCTEIISDAMTDCAASVPCGSPFDDHDNLRSDYYSCMNYDYLSCIKSHNGGEDYKSYGSCFLNYGFCNKNVVWYGADTNPTQSEVLPLYVMSEREYRACNLKSGYFSVGLDLKIYLNDSVDGCVNKTTHIECKEKEQVDELASVLDPITIDGNNYRQFGLCGAGISDVFNNSNLLSNATYLIMEINSTDKPFMNGGIMANEGTGFFWDYDPYTNDKWSKNITFYVIEYDFLPSSYDDLNQQQYLFQYSTDYGKSILKGYLR